MESELANIYASTVRQNGHISSSLGYGGHAPVYERDPNLIKLEQNVFSQIAELTKEETVSKPVYKTSGLKTVSFEEALKELLELEKDSNS